MLIFGVSISNLQQHIHYALTEGHWPNVKAPNPFISMIHDALRRTVLRRQGLHADNWGEQKKNSYVIRYLALRTIVGLADTCVLHFMIVGHTKSAPDAYFGLAKQHLRRKNALTPEQVVGRA